MEVFLSQIRRAILTLLVALLLGTGVAALSPGSFLIGWLSSSLILWLSLYGMWAAWRFGGGSSTLAWIMLLAFVLRAGLGIALNKALPVYGYDTEVQYHGYLFRDAHERDIAAWNLAESNSPLWVSFGSEIKVDQYGGLLSLSALIYRYLSPDAHRPYLVLILGAFVTAVGLAFFHRTVSQRWNARLANLATWILALYPDGVLFGSSQMREPFLLGLGLIAFWAVAAKGKSRTRILVITASFLCMLLISSRMAVAMAGFLGIWFLIETLLPRYQGPRWALWTAAILGGLLVLGLSYGWLVESSSLDFYLTESSSGWVQKIIDQTGEVFRIPFLTLYGLARPVLPAAIAEPTLPLWQSIGILRSTGWYALAPLLIYAIFSFFKTEKLADRRILLWMAAFSIFWLILSSARAGGDAWDNPRYRVAFLPWMALLASWALLWAREKRDGWLLRWVLVEMICLAFFTNWYISRYYQWWGRLPFWQMLAWILGLSALVLSSGIWWKWIRKKKS
jgi:hypothetical protein